MSGRPNPFGPGEMPEEFGEVPSTYLSLVDQPDEFELAAMEKKNRRPASYDKRKAMTPHEVMKCARYAAMRAESSDTWKFKEQAFLLLHCGLRSCEVLQLRISDVRLDLVKPWIHIERAKGGKTAHIQLPWAYATARFGWFLSWRKQQFGMSEPHDHWLVRANSRKPMCYQDIWQTFRACTTPLPYDRRPELSSHSGRHSAATNLIKAGHSLPTVQHFMRHASIGTTQIYLQGEELEPGDLYGTGEVGCVDDQIEEAWNGPRATARLREEIEDLALNTPKECYVDQTVIRRIQKLWQQARVYGDRHEMMTECYRALNLPPSLYGHYHYDRAWREVVVWRWLSWNYYHTELEFHYGEREVVAPAWEDAEQAGAIDCEFVARPTAERLPQRRLSE